MLRSKRLYLKPIDKNDLNFYKKLYSDSDLMKYIMPLPSVHKTEISFNLVLKRLANTTRQRLLYVITINSGDSPIGIIGLTWNQESVNDAELGTIIIPEAQRKGYAQEARKLLLIHAFKKLNVENIIGYTDVNNKAINALNNKLGSINHGIVFNQKRNRKEIKWIINYENFVKAN
jgi:RimJ/RimL family protein N-acetyltransferase